MIELDSLIEKHRGSGLLLDANLLLLYLIGVTNKQRILDFKRTQTYTIPDFDLLQRLVLCFRAIVTTPHVLTEISNLANLHGKELTAFRARFKSMVDVMNEVYDESRIVMSDPSFLQRGLSDAAIILATRLRLLVLTADVQLYVTLIRRGVDVINFNHIRTFRQ